MKERSLILFEQGVKAQSTLNNYRDHLKRFMKFAKSDSYDSLIKTPLEKLQILIEDYLIYLKETCHPNSIPILMLGVRHFFIMNKIPIHWEIIRKMYPQRLKSSGDKPWTTEQIQKMLSVTISKRNKAFIHFLVSTGARIGVIEYDLSMKHLHDIEDGCKAILLYPDDTEEYWAFLTPEASKSLDEYFEQRKKDGEVFTPDSPVFRTNYRKGNEPVHRWKREGATAMMYRIIQNIDCQRKKVNHHFDIQMDHGFRKRYNTILKLKNEVNSNIAEKLMGHKNGLDGVYLKPTREQCFAEFKKAITDLMIDSSQRHQLKITTLLKEKSELENYKQKVDELWIDKLRMEHIRTHA